MELKQLEFFVTTTEAGSINQAAECLYTSQPNVSKVIGAFEKEIGFPLFTRNSKGVELTQEGKKIYEYAKIVLKNADIMKSIAKKAIIKKFSVSCYPSHMLSSVFVDFYKKRVQEDLLYEFYEGTVEEITDHVASGQSEIGILYLSEHQLQSFKHIMGHKHLLFQPLEKKELCIYVGRHSILYERESIIFSELEKLKFVQPIKDFFSLEHHLESISVGAFCMENFQNMVYTNSDNLLVDLLMNTDICSFGIYYMDSSYDTYDIKPLRLQGCSKCLTLGYVRREGYSLSQEAISFIEEIKISLKRSC